MKTCILLPLTIGAAYGFTTSKPQSLQSAVHTRQRTSHLFAVQTDVQTNGLFESLFAKPSGSKRQRTSTSVERFYEAWKNQDIDTAIAQFTDNVYYEDATFYNAFKGKAELQRQLLLRQDATSGDVIYVLDEVVKDGTKVGVKYHLEQKDDGKVVSNSRHCAFFTLDAATGLITSVYDVVEPANKTGNLDLAILSAASKIIGKGDKPETIDEPKAKLVDENKGTGWMGLMFQAKKGSANEKGSLLSLTLPEQYFEAWNQRDMDAAIDLFTDDCTYEDTVFPTPFSGKANLESHLDYCSDAFPPTFSFVVDDVANGGDAVAVRWHVENDGKPMPFTRGCSFYTIDNHRIQSGFDEIEPAVWKLGGLNLFASSLKTKLVQEPIRLIPLALWAAYMYIVFFSDGILPGANALELEQRTWEEVRDLSLNFFLVAPILDLPFSPTVHPILEGVFNVLLSWAALFAGFFSDERDDKPNLLPVVPTIVGMQFLTSAFLLPYLATRTSEKDNVVVYEDDLNSPTRLVESRLLGSFLGLVGAESMAWGAFGRAADFGGWNERVATFWQLMSIDRVGSSFLVDLAIFALFQGWLIDDDMKRRGIRIQDGELARLRNVAKFVPFFGMAAYMTLRPSFPSRQDDE